MLDCQAINRTHLCAAISCARDAGSELSNSFTFNASYCAAPLRLHYYSSDKLLTYAEPIGLKYLISHFSFLVRSADPFHYRCQL